MNGLAFVVALGVVALFAVVGFDAPSWSRSYTTAARYRFALAAHVVIYLVFFLTAFAVIEHLPIAAWTDRARRLAPIGAALALTLALRATPPVARALRGHLHAMAGITDHAVRRAFSLAESDIEPSPAIVKRAKTMLLAYGIDQGRDWLPPAEPLHRQMLRAAALFVPIRDWETDKRFAAFLRETANELFRLRQRFDGLAFRVARTLATIESLAEVRHLCCEHSVSSTDIDKRIKRMVENLISDACEDVALFHRDACLVAVRGVLATEPTRRGRERAIRRLGFVKSEPEVLSVYRVFPYAAALLFVGLWVFFLVLPPETPSVQDLHTLTIGQRIVIILLIVMGAIAIAIFPKLHYGFANGGLRQRTPWPFLFAAGAFAVLLAVLVNVEAGALLYGGRAGAWERLLEGLPYAPSAFLTASCVAWLVQDHRYRSIASPWMRRLCDAAIFGGVWLAASAIATWLQTGTMLPSRIATIPCAFVFGAAMGALIPELVRNPRLRRADGTIAAPPQYARSPTNAPPRLEREISRPRAST